MGFGRRPVLGSLRAAVRLCLGRGVEAASVECTGDGELVAHLPAATWDKLLVNLARSKEEQIDLLLRFEEMVRLAVDALEEEGSITLAGIPLTEHVASPDLTATIEISMGQRLGATTKFKPLRRADSSTAEAALWTVWDSTVQAVPDEYAAMLGNLLHQCDYYHEVGLPRLRDVGKAPFYGAMKGSGARLANELGASVGMTGEEFQALPIEERHRLYRIVGEGK